MDTRKNRSCPACHSIFTHPPKGKVAYLFFFFFLDLFLAFFFFLGSTGALSSLKFCTSSVRCARFLPLMSRTKDVKLSSAASSRRDASRRDNWKKCWREERVRLATEDSWTRRATTASASTVHSSCCSLNMVVLEGGKRSKSRTVMYWPRIQIQLIVQRQE